MCVLKICLIWSFVQAGRQLQYLISHDGSQKTKGGQERNNNNNNNRPRFVLSFLIGHHCILSGARSSPDR